MLNKLEALIQSRASTSDRRSSSHETNDPNASPGECLVNHAADGTVVDVVVRECGLPGFPAILSQLPDLEQLDLSGNRLTALPDDIGDLPRLTRLVLDDNQLAALPESLGALTSLRWLALDGNALTDLPAAISRLPQLEKLDLRWNKLTGSQPWLRDLERRGCVVLR